MMSKCCRNSEIVNAGQFISKILAPLHSMYSQWIHDTNGIVANHFSLSILVFYVVLKETKPQKIVCIFEASLKKSQMSIMKLGAPG